MLMVTYSKDSQCPGPFPDPSRDHQGALAIVPHPRVMTAGELDAAYSGKISLGKK